MSKPIPEFQMNEQAVTLLMENGPGNMDVRAFIIQQSSDYPPRIRVAYQVTDADGEDIDAGIEGPEEGHTMLPDDIEQAEGVTSVALAANFLVGRYAYNTSASQFHPGIWYENEGEPIPHGQRIRHSFHLQGFTPEEEAEVYQYMKDTFKRHL